MNGKASLLCSLPTFLLFLLHVAYTDLINH